MNRNKDRQKHSNDFLRILKKLKEAFSIQLVFAVILIALIPIGFQLIIGTVESKTSEAKSALISSNAEIQLIETVSKQAHREKIMSRSQLVQFDKETRKLLSDKQSEKNMREREVASKSKEEFWTKIVLQLLTLIISAIGLFALTRELEDKFRTFGLAVALGIFAFAQAVAGLFPFFS